MPSLLPFRPRSPRTSQSHDYQRGWSDGWDAGKKWAAERLFWFGTAAGAVLMTVGLLGSFYLTR